MKCLSYLIAAFFFLTMTTATADTIFWNEDFEGGDPVGGPYVNMSEMTPGNLSGQYSIYQDPNIAGNPQQFNMAWAVNQGSGAVTSAGGNQFLQIWHTGLEANWGKTVVNHIGDLRGAYNLPMVVEFRFRPGYNPSGNGYTDSDTGDRVLACKFQFANDEFVDKFRLYYDGFFRWRHDDGTANLVVSDVDASTIFDISQDRWLYFKEFVDPHAQKAKVYLSSDSTVDESDLIASVKNPSIQVDEVHFRQMGELQGGSGTDDPSESFKCSYDDLKVSYLDAYYLRGTVTMEYPGWQQEEAIIEYQVRDDNTPPTEPIYTGNLTLSGTPGNPWSAPLEIGPVVDGTYDIAVRAYGRVADMENNVGVSGADVEGLSFGLWAGDVDYDNDIDFYDYYGLYYGYLYNPDPGNWAYGIDPVPPGATPPAGTTIETWDFESFSLGTIEGQQGWTLANPATQQGDIVTDGDANPDKELKLTKGRALSPDGGNTPGAGGDVGIFSVDMIVDDWSVGGEIAGAKIVCHWDDGEENAPEGDDIKVELRINYDSTTGRQEDGLQIYYRHDNEGGFGNDIFFPGAWDSSAYEGTEVNWTVVLDTSEKKIKIYFNNSFLASSNISGDTFNAGRLRWKYAHLPCIWTAGFAANGPAVYDNMEIRQAEGVGAYYLRGTVTMEYPGWEAENLLVRYQLREPDSLTNLYYADTLTLSGTAGGSWSAPFEIGAFPEGSYDVAIKTYARTANMTEDVVIDGADVEGLSFGLWAGDFDEDNDIDFYDYYGLYYGYLYSPDPGNWYFY